MSDTFDLIGPEQVAVILGVTRQTVCRWLRDGVLRGQKVGQRWVIRREDVIGLPGWRVEK